MALIRATKPNKITNNKLFKFHKNKTYFINSFIYLFIHSFIPIT